MFSEADLRERVLAMVGCVRSTHGDCGDPMLLARHLGLKVVVSHYDGDQDGFHVEDVVVLGTQQGQTPERVRFTLYHEICHHLLRQDEELWSELHDCVARDRDFGAVVERLCNLGAAEFLLPRSYIRPILETEGVSVALIERLAGHFKASRLATAIQIVDCATHACILVVAARVEPPSIRHPRMLSPGNSSPAPLVVERAMPSRKARYTVGRHTPIRRTSIIAAAEAGEERRVLSERDWVPVRSGKKWEVDAEAVRLGTRVYSLFHLESPVPPCAGQLRLL